MPFQNECALNLISIIYNTLEEDNNIILNNILTKIKEYIGFNVKINVKELNDFISFVRIGNDVNYLDIFVKKNKNKHCSIYVFYVLNKITIRTEKYENFSDFSENNSWCFNAVHDITEINDLCYL